MKSWPEYTRITSSSRRYPEVIVIFDSHWDLKRDITSSSMVFGRDGVPGIVGESQRLCDAIIRTTIDVGAGALSVRLYQLFQPSSRGCHVR